MSQLAEATRRAEAAEDETAAVQRTADSLQARCAHVAVIFSPPTGQ